MLRMFFFLRVVWDLQSDSINAVASVLLCCGLKILIYRFNIEVQHCCAKIVRIFVLVSRSSKVFWVGG